MNCRNCGAPLLQEQETCSYCGTITPYGELCEAERRRDKVRQEIEAEKVKREEEKQRQIQEAGRFREEEAKRERAKFRYVPLWLCPVLYVCTFMIYGLYWYISRAGSLNALETGKKLNKWLCVSYAVLCIALVLFPGTAERYGITSDGQAGTYWGISMYFAIGLSVWLAFRSHNILRRYSSKYYVPKWSFNPFVILLAFVGPLYLQYEVNSLIRKGILKAK